MTKYCKDCKFADMGKKPYHMNCWHPQISITTIIDNYVSGPQDSINWVLCYKERQACWRPCGPDAKLWEPGLWFIIKSLFKWR